MLAQALNTNPAIRCFREVFHFMHDYVDYGIEGFDPNVPADVEFRNSDPVRFLNERLYAGAPSGVQAVGFKYLYGHFWGFDALTDHLSDAHEIRVIHLKRRNMLRSLVSLRIAESSGRWLEDWGVEPRPSTWATKLNSAVFHPARTVTRLRKRMREREQRWEEKSGLRLGVPECIAFFDRTAKEVARADAIADGHPTLTVWYEEFLDDRDATFDRVQRFLSVEPQHLTVTVQRQNPEPLSKLIANYAEVARGLAATPYATFLDP